jgi:hypothetical protein
VRGLGLVACLFRVRGTRENNSLNSENLCNFQTFEFIINRIFIDTHSLIQLDILYKDERSCMISLHDIMIINVLIAKGMYLEGLEV